jgi:hypothetical protein
LDEIAPLVYEEKSGQAFVYLATHRKKTPFLSKGHNSAKNHSTRKPVQYAQGLELQINPVKFH